MRASYDPIAVLAQARRAAMTRWRDAGGAGAQPREDPCGTRREVHAGIRPRSWIVGALCTLTCVSFVAHAANDVIEARYLADPPVAPPLPRAAHSSPPAVSPDTRQASVLVDRNPFCSDCTGTDDPISPAGDVATSRRPLVLVATSLGEAPFASIRNLETGGQGAFALGEELPGVGVLEKVAGTYVVIRSQSGAERLDLLAVPTTAGSSSAGAGQVGKGVGGAAAAAKPGTGPAWAARVRKIDDVTFEVDRELVRELVGGGATAKVPGVRVTPATGKDGKLRGVKVSRASKDSLAAGLGLRSGDVIEALDGHAITGPDVLLEAYGRLESAAQVRVSVSRGGKPVELDYRLR
jgi:type II secretory pathway component PulC